ncbi:aldehyde dehydrogenase family protein, partial [Microbacterium sp. GbtcB4]|uniref:aldehyde dehydrogenase family protein n=1 Tax=Microbacterium sp. GbtcB4 TaxID=2824749 RepID=UPI001C2FF260
AAKPSHKAARDAGVAARAAVKGWPGATAYHRGQVLYRVAEVHEGRRAQFGDESVAQEGIPSSAATAQGEGRIDLWVWYA